MRSASVRERFDALRAVRELASCSDDDVWSLVAYADEVSLRAGERVAYEGRLCTEFLVVIDGTLRSRSDVIGHGDSSGWNAMWERSANPATVVAQTNARVLVMSHAQFRAVKALVVREPCTPDEARVQIVA